MSVRRAPPRRRLIALASLLLVAGLAACGPSGTGRTAPPTAAAPHVPAASRVAPNELGVIPVLMYHRILAAPQSVDDRTPTDFRAELERLAREDYVPITTADLVARRIDIPAGTHPVVLTFDDGSASQLSLGPDGQPTPDCAIGILLDVARHHPGFTPVASLYVNEHPFGEPGGTRTLRWLHDHGFEIGDHTLNHVDLASVSATEVQHQIVTEQQLILRAVPDVQVVTMALPFGIHPRQRDLSLRGSADGTSYDLHGVLLAGANPAPSPYSATFDPLDIPRIRSEAGAGPEARFGSTAWLDELDAHAATRYTSDGDPDHVTFPAALAGKLAPAFAGEARPY